MHIVLLVIHTSKSTVVTISPYIILCSIMGIIRLKPVLGPYIVYVASTLAYSKYYYLIRHLLVVPGRAAGVSPRQGGPKIW